LSIFPAKLPILSGFLSVTVVSPSDHKSLSKFTTSASDASIGRNRQHVNTLFGRRSNRQVSRPLGSNHQGNRRQRHRWRHHQSPCWQRTSNSPHHRLRLSRTKPKLRRHVWLPQVLVGELMLLSGLGQIMTIPPNVRHSDYYQRVQTAAMNGFKEPCPLMPKR